MKGILGLATLFLLLFPTSVLATTWVKVTASTKNDIIYIDPNSIVGSGSIKNYWERMELSTLTSTRVSAYVSRKTISCKARLMQIDKLVGYDSSGEVIYSSEHSFSPDLIVPDTTGEAVLKYVCSH